MTREEAANILDPEMDIQYLFNYIREHYGKRGVDDAFLCECVDAEACHMGAEALRRIDALALDGKHEEGCARKKIALIWKIAHLETLNGVTKAELQSMLKWLVEHHFYCSGEE